MSGLLATGARGRPSARLLAVALAAAACGPAAPADPADAGAVDAGAADAGPDPFADRVVSFSPGEGAGYGQEKLPGVVLGAPRGGGDQAGGLDVLSLGREGSIVLAFDDVEATDGEGPDLIVFENAFSGYVETGVVAASADGVDWREWTCDAAGQEKTGCAGVRPVFAAPGNGVDPTDPARAGGDAFDLAAVGLARARYVRVRDSGANTYGCCAGGFDLDAVAVAHGAPIFP